MTKGSGKVIALNRAETAKERSRGTFGRAIREGRLNKGMTQPQLAAQLGVTKNTVCNWESGFARPDMDLVLSLCRALDISLVTLFGGEDEWDGLTAAQKRHLKSYGLLGPRDQAAVDALTEALLSMEDEETRKRCLEGFTARFHNANLAAAGSVNPLEDGLSGETEFLRCSELTRRTDEIVTVTGDSMEPTFYAGDDLLVEHTDTLHPGEIGLFVINGEGFVKECGEGGVISHNRAYPFRRFCPGDDVRIAGRVLGKVTDAMRPTRQEAQVLGELHREGLI